MTKKSFYSNDRSIILQITHSFFFTPIIEKLPISLKPNFITISGFLCVLISGFFIFLASRDFVPGYLFGCIFLFLYFLSDNLDGMHARNTNQTSWFGGFLDQWFDTISLYVIAMSLMSCLQVRGAFFVIILLMLSVTCLILYLEQYHKGDFYKPAFGPNEYLIIIMAIYFSLYFYHGNPQFIFKYNTINNVTILSLIAISISVFYLLRGFFVVKIAFARLFIPLLTYLIISVLYFFHTISSTVVVSIALTLINAVYIGLILLIQNPNNVLLTLLSKAQLIVPKNIT